MVTSKNVSVAFMHHGIVTVPKGTRLTHEGPDGIINPQLFWVADHNAITDKISGPCKSVQLAYSIITHGLQVPRNCVEFTDLHIIATHWDNPVKKPITIEFTGKMQRRFLANVMHIMGIGMRKFLKLFF